MEGHRADHRSESDLLGPFGGQGERGPAVDAVALVVAHQGDQVLAPSQGFEAERFDVVAEPPPALPVEAFLTFDHDPELGHDRLIVSCSRCSRCERARNAGARLRESKPVSLLQQRSTMSWSVGSTRPTQSASMSTSRLGFRKAAQL